MDRETAHREWLVEADLVSHEKGLATVEMRLTNGRMGRLPTFNMVVDWKPGMERPDVVANALSILADGAVALGDALIKEAASTLAKEG